MAKFDPFLSLDCTGLAQSQERKGSNLTVYRGGAVVIEARRAKGIQSNNSDVAI